MGSILKILKKILLPFVCGVPFHLSRPVFERVNMSTKTYGAYCIYYRLNIEPYSCSTSLFSASTTFSTFLIIKKLMKMKTRPTRTYGTQQRLY
jgi:hypothetical protein